MPKIFLSYRRDDSEDAAGRIFDRLVVHFGREHLFMDVDTIPFGVDFRKHIADAVGRCDVVLVIIGTDWLEICHRDGPKAGQRRLEDPGDAVRLEIQAGLERNIPVIPVLIGGAPIPDEQRLPDILKPLVARNAAEVRSGRDFHAHMDRLIRGIEELFKPPPKPEMEARVSSVQEVRNPAPAPVAPSPAPRPRARIDSNAVKVHRFTGHEGAITCLALSPDGGLALSGGRDARVRSWVLRAEAALRTFEGHSKPIGSVGLFPDGRSVVSSSADGNVRIDSVVAGVATRVGPQTNWAVALSPDGTLALSGSPSEASLFLWQVHNAATVRVFRGHTEYVRSIAFSPDGRRALSSSRDQTVRLWDVNTGQQLLSFNVPKVWLTTICFTPDGQRAVTGNGSAVSVWDLSTGRESRRLSGHAGDVLAVAVSADGSRAVSGSVDGTVRVWDLASGQELLCLTGHEGEVSAVAISANGQILLSGGEDRALCCWRLPS
jgi:WD40 repeat protein